jgi:ELWxxDGT repeat protein
MKKMPLLLCLSILCCALQAQTLVADINTLPRGSHPERLRSSGSGVVFLADSETYGQELFHSNGTSAGTELILDAAKGVASGDYLDFDVFNQRCYVLSYAENTVTLWRYQFNNKRLNVLRQFTDLKGASRHNSGRFTQVGNEVFFWIGGNNTHELWKIRASSGQVERVAQFPDLLTLGEMGALNNLLVFSAVYKNGNTELWRSNGSPSGTQMIHTFNGAGAFVSNLQNFQNQLVFIAKDAANGQEIWSTDGQSAAILLNLVPGTGSYQPQGLAVNKNFLYFAAEDEQTGAEMWQSNGTLANTRSIGNIFSKKQRISGFKRLNPYDLGVMITVFNDSTQTEELWYFGSQGAAIARKIKALAEPGYLFGKNLQGVSDGFFFYFLARAPRYGTELWVIRSITQTPGRLVRDIYPGIGSSEIQHLTLTTQGAFFSAETDQHGPELWFSNGQSKTYQVSTLNQRNGDSKPGNFFIFRDYFLFTANQPATGRETWVSKGNGSSTGLLSDINPGKGSSFPANFTPQQGLTYLFTAFTEDHGVELWRSMVVNERATLVKDINPGHLPGAYSSMSQLKNKVLFGGQTLTEGNELWISDGTSSGTQLLKDIWPGSNASQPTLYGAAGVFGDSVVVFLANDGTGPELWRSNGTAAGTYPLLDMNPGAGGISLLGKLTRLGRYAYFSVYSQNQGYRVWRTNGTKAGTEAIASALGQNFVAYQDKILFNGEEPYSGAELWCYDTLRRFSFLLNDINPGPASSNPANFAVFDKLLYFSANDGKSGVELWKTNGIRNATTLFQDINPGAASSFPQELLAHGAYLHFSAEEPFTGRELWYLPAGAPYAKPRADLNTGSASSNPAELTLYFNEIFFRADDGKSGIELWKIAMPDVANLREETAAVIPPTLLLAPTPQDIPRVSL